MRKTRNFEAEIHVVVGDFVAFIYSRRVTDAELVREIRQLKEVGSLPGTLHQGRILIHAGVVSLWPRMISSG